MTRPEGVVGNVAASSAAAFTKLLGYGIPKERKRLFGFEQDVDGSE
jgi:hypothetical protein